MNKRTLDRFCALPVNADETWQGGVVSITDVFGVSTAAETGEMVLALWRSAATELMHAKPISSTPEQCLSGFAEAMCELCGQNDFPFRPARIECNEPTLVDGLNELLRGSGTTVVFVAEMTEWDATLQEMIEHLNPASPSLDSLMDVGCTERQIREFADAAAAFYRAGLWDYLEDVDLIKIEAPRPPRNMNYAVVLGAAWETFGLGFYHDAEDHYDMMAQRVDPRESSLCSLTFGSPADVRSVDVELWNELDLPLETGEAFPSLVFYSPDGVRRPTSRELEFVTILLKALAATSEDEIDSARWTKLVEFRGKQKKCVLAIPNLLDPPDRQEWMRRGMQPDARGHEPIFQQIHEFIEKHGGNMSLDELNEVINQRFTGPMDDIEFPLDTPADRAAALCRQAVESFGRRRVQMTRQALAEDPTHVEANVLLGESIRRAERRIEVFQNAVELGRSQLGSLMEEAAGQFWGVTETRSFMRACHGLAAALHEAGRTNEAIEQYQEMLQLNPNDNQGVRYEVIPLLLMQNREPEAIGLLDRYQEASAHWHYLKSLAEFRHSGRSARARQALRSAFGVNKHVVMQFDANEPPLFPDSYTPGSPEEAAICARELMEAWEESDGYLPWMFEEFSRWEREKAKRRRDRQRQQRKKTTGRKRRR